MFFEEADLFLYPHSTLPSFNRVHILYFVIKVVSGMTNDAHPLIHFHWKRNVCRIGSRLKECCPICEEEKAEQKKEIKCLHALLRTDNTA